MKTINKVLIKKNITCKPIWFMRQAGRHLPEFRKIRKLNPNFIKLCLNPKLSSKITLQPVKRYNIDAAIIFSDILVIPYALGQTIDFTGRSGPKLNKFNKEIFFNNTDKKFISILKPTYKAIKITKKKLNKKKSLIAFVGAPWTLMVYMLDLKNKKNQLDLKKLRNRPLVKRILNKLTNYICIHIEKQMKAGADLVQIFDSWASLIPKKNLYNYCFNPNLKIVEYCKRKKIPIICFPRGLKNKYSEFAKIVKPDGLNLDTNIKPDWALKNLSNVTLQGGLDPKILLKSNKKMIQEAKKYLDAFKDVSYIFNLGHGMRPETEPKKVKKLIKFVRNYK